MRFFTLIIHTLPANTIGAAVEWCVLIVHTRSPPPAPRVCVCVWQKHYRSGPRLFTSTNKHEQTQMWRDVFSFNQCLHKTLLLIHKTNTATQTQTNKQRLNYTAGLKLLLQTILPLYYIVLFHRQCNSALQMAVFPLVFIPCARKGDVQWQCFKTSKYNWKTEVCSTNMRRNVLEEKDNKEREYRIQNNTTCFFYLNLSWDKF